MNVFAIISDSEFWLSVSWVDGVAVFLVLVAAAVGFWSGFVWQIVRLGNILAAFVVASHYYTAVAAGLRAPAQQASRLAFSYAFLFMGVMVVGYAVCFVARAPINAIKPELSDRVLGAVLGLVKGLFLCGIVALVLLRHGAVLGSVEAPVKSSPTMQITANWVGFFHGAVSGTEEP